MIKKINFISKEITSANDKLNGIFAFLKTFYKTSDLQGSKIISFSESSIRSDSQPVSAITGFNNPNYNKYWTTENTAGNWLKIDMINNPILLKGITIHTYDCDFYAQYSLELSNDSFTWENLTINGPQTKPSKLLSLYNDVSYTKFVRFIRIKGISKLYNTVENLAFYGLELFGNVLLDKYKCTMNRRMIIPLKNYALLIVLYS